MTLYEINEAILACVDPETGEVDETRLGDLMIERDEKIENVALWIKDLKAEATAIKAEIDALTERKKAAESKVERLKGFLGTALEGQKFKTARTSVSFTHTKAVIIDDPDVIPFEYVRTKVEPDKVAIKEALKNGNTIAGARLEERESVVIK